MKLLKQSKLDLTSPHIYQKPSKAQPRNVSYRKRLERIFQENKTYVAKESLTTLLYPCYLDRTEAVLLDSTSKALWDNTWILLDYECHMLLQTTYRTRPRWEFMHMQIPLIFRSKAFKVLNFVIWTTNFNLHRSYIIYCKGQGSWFKVKCYHLAVFVHTLNVFRGTGNIKHPVDNKIQNRYQRKVEISAGHS